MQIQTSTGVRITMNPADHISASAVLSLFLLNGHLEETGTHRAVRPGFVQ